MQRALCFSVPRPSLRGRVVRGSIGIALLALAGIGCTVRETGVRPGPDDGTRDAGIGGGGDTLDGGDGGGTNSGDGGGRPMGWDGSSPVNPCSTGCGPEEICGPSGDGNGLDDDCDGEVDEDCTCVVGQTRPCFAGPPDRRDIGACSDGIEACTEFGTWGACRGGVSPMAETCNGADDDCNGSTDDLAGCNSAVMCPGNQVAPPLSSFTLRGDTVYTGNARAWSWSIDCPDSVAAELCPQLATPNAENTDLYITASGAYRVNVTVTLEDGTTASCAWTLYVRGGGLRVELGWDTMYPDRGGSDVDLHLHRWTRNGVDTAFFNGDDCYFSNCTPGGNLEWADHPDSPLENCDEAPRGGGAIWTGRGSCRNPRLDVDTNAGGACDPNETDPSSYDFCAPENINVDEPIIGMPYRVMVNYWTARGVTGTTNPTVNIYCGGALRGSFGQDPLIELENSPSLGEPNDNWYVADVVFFEADCGLDCIVHPINTVMQGTDDAVPFGVPWSCDYDAAAHTCTPR